ncbi:MAG: 4-hydroxythreonine-4-phosphate dehydrogenase PdxA [Ignavibacteria bacterium]|jgi:4-hydroxythreonine-4-phosphate dehydrogenase|nr:4-hydroxythreonine-4-phosphate dehydrogenase PdxA [Ignavibacteria bacterium]MDH7527096.1 4-hydroxythreonine-4-phosphate dehydrogenase PdxA [Ignavibacteria bacterium]
MIKIGITCGDINGIGPEITIKAIKNLRGDYKFYLIGPKNIFLNLISKLKLEDYSNIEFVDLGKYSQNLGSPTVMSGKLSLRAIYESLKLWDEKIIDVVVTAPISKEAISKAGSKFPGHTEIYASHFKTKNFVMMFLSNSFYAGLATIHIPIKDVPRVLNLELLENKISIVRKTLIQDFNIRSPKIAVLGLNPHAGESDLIGTEETQIIEPAIIKLSGNKFGIYGPFSSDGFFGRKEYKNYDCVFGMYHDQVLIPFKLLNFNNGVNFTAGLPIIRTSPDHGTAFNLAGKNLADHRSMLEAIKFAIKIFKTRNKIK